MKNLKTSLLVFLLAVIYSNSQDNSDSDYKPIGSCEGCDAIFEYGERELSAVDTLPEFDLDGPKLKVTGTIYENDGKTPAKNVILYIYHTNQKGLYPTTGKEKGWDRRHGYIRGWIKTGSNGRYTFYTLKPGVYPSRTEPAHIHPIILEPNGKYYWLSSFLFDDDPLLLERHLKPANPRGGSNGVLKLQRDGDLLVGRRDFILGKNIRRYNQ